MTAPDSSSHPAQPDAPELSPLVDVLGVSASPGGAVPAVIAGAAAGAAQPRMRADARRNRERIIQAAREVFAESGADAQMDEVAAAAGVGVGTVYRHFPNKDALIGELVRQKFEKIADGLRQAKELDLDPGEALLWSLRYNAEQLEDDLATQHVMSGAPRPVVWQLCASNVTEVNELATELIEGGVASGTLRADMQVSDIRLVMGGITSTMADPATRPMWRRHLELMLDALRGPAAARG